MGIEARLTCHLPKLWTPRQTSCSLSISSSHLWSECHRKPAGDTQMGRADAARFIKTSVGIPSRRPSLAFCAGPHCQGPANCEVKQTSLWENFINVPSVCLSFISTKTFWRKLSMLGRIHACHYSNKLKQAEHPQSTPVHHRLVSAPDLELNMA